MRLTARMADRLPRTADVVVVGGGVMGASVAFHLAEAGVGVLLLERDGLGQGSSGKPLGGVRAQFSDPLNVELGARSLRAYEAFGDRPGADIGLQQVGYLFMLPTADDVEVFRRSVAGQNALGVPSRVIGTDEARALNPFLDAGAYTAAAWSPSDGWARPGAVVDGYVRAARRLGAHVRTGTPVEAVVVRGGRVRAVRTRDGEVSTGTVVCCAGAWSASVGALAGVSLPVVPLRRQIAFCGPFTRPPGTPPMPFTIDFGSTFYVHDAGTGPDAEVLLGLADPDQAPGFDRAYDPSWLPLLRGAARRCVPDLADLPVRSGWAGL